MQILDLEFGLMPKKKSKKGRLKCCCSDKNRKLQLEEEKWLSKQYGDGKIGCQPKRRKQDGNTQISLTVCILHSQRVVVSEITAGNLSFK